MLRFRNSLENKDYFFLDIFMIENTSYKLLEDNKQMFEICYWINNFKYLFKLCVGKSTSR